MPLPAVPAAMLAGALLGTAWDRLHVAAGALSYSGTENLQPWWVPLEFAVAGLLILIGVRVLGDPLPDARSPRRALGEVAWFSALYASTALLWRQPAILTALLAVALAARLPAVQRAGSANAIPAVALVIGGPAVEALVSLSGLFAYARPDFARIPLWLPVLYMNAVPLVVRGTEALLWSTRSRSSNTKG